MNERHSQFTAEERYRLLVEAVTDYAIYMLDPDGLVVSWNSGAQRLKGYTEQEILGRNFSTFYLPEDVSAGIPQRVLETAARLGRFEAEGWRVSKGGDRFWASVVVEPIRTGDGALIGFAKVTRDLTRQREVQESLRRSEQQFRLLVQGVTDYSIYMVDPKGFVTNWNSGAQRITGYTPEDVVGSHFSRFYRPEDQQNGDPSRALATAEKEGRFESEGWRVRKDGTHFRANVVVDPIRDANNELIGFAKVTRDVTEKRDAQLKLDQSREALFQSQKLDAIGQLTGGVAHDFNNLLMVVLSSLELIRRRLGGNTMLERLVDNALTGARRGVTLTQRMLAFARRQELKPISVDVPLLVAGMTDLLERSLGPSIAIETNFEDKLPLVMIDPNQLELALLNLAVNARDAMPHGGRIVVAARSADGVLKPGKFVCISISDDGQGMDDATRARAVEPFFTTKGLGKGTGLGLPMVHGVAAQSGGELILKSEVGRGTTAELWLPVAVAGPKAAVPETAKDPEPVQVPPRPLLILVVDDDSLVLEGTIAMLEDIGHTAVGAGSAREALAVLSHSRDVGLVITDEAMPVTRGSELIDILRAQRPELPVVLATGYAQLDAAMDPTVGRLSKPFDQQALREAIARARSQERLPAKAFDGDGVGQD